MADKGGSSYGLGERIGYSLVSVVVQLILASICLLLGAYTGSLVLQWLPFIGISTTPPGIVYAHNADDLLPDGTPIGRRLGPATQEHWDIRM